MRTYRKLKDAGVCGHQHRTFERAALCGGRDTNFIQVSDDGFKTWRWAAE